MPLQTCPKCGRFHYVPGDCPPSKLERSNPKAVEPDDTSKPPLRSNASRNADRHKPGYQAQKQREYRARKKASNQS